MQRIKPDARSLAALCLSALLVFAFLPLSACQSPDGSGDVAEIRIALLIDDGNPQSGLVFEAFRKDLEEHIGIPVRVIEGATHLVGIEAMRAGNLDIMWGSPFVYLLARDATEVERLVVTENPASINKTVFITANDRIHTLDDMRGGTFAFISPASTSGFLYPMYHLMNMLNMERDDILTGGFFDTVTYSGSQDASIMGTVHGDFDAAAVGGIFIENMTERGLINPGDIKVIAETPPLPDPGYIVRTALGEDVVARIREFFMEYRSEDYFTHNWGGGNDRFSPPDVEGFTYFRSVVRTLGLD
jgi:phosphonate transport system substrate-binding protein